MKRTFLAAVILAAAFLIHHALAAAATATSSPASKVAAYTKDPGPLAVATLLQDWKDDARNRVVPVKIYYPKAGEGKLVAPYPVIVFSHGLGGSREGYKYLGEHWASWGYVSVHLQHIGSDTAVWQGTGAGAMAAMQKAAANPSNALNRPQDVKFALDRLAKINKEDGPLKGLLDMDRVGMAGHSFGSYTTLAVSGEVFIAPGGKETSVADERIKAAIAMSSPVPGSKAGSSEKLDLAFGRIKIPVFHMTGTKDNSPVGETVASDRRLPFDHSKGPNQYLLTFTGGDHMVFSGRVVRQEQDAIFQGLILAGSTAFWDAYLKGDPAAKSWLADGGFEKALGKEGKFEKK